MRVWSASESRAVNVCSYLKKIDSYTTLCVDKYIRVTHILIQVGIELR